MSLWTSGDLALAVEPTALSDKLGTAFRASSKRLRGTIIVIRVEDHAKPWIILTDLAPLEAGALWRALLFWIETCFNALKSVGAAAEEPRIGPARADLHWLVLSGATALTLASGCRAEDVQALKRSLSAPLAPPKAAPERNRLASALRLGLSTLSRLPTNGGIWRRVRLPPEPCPPPRRA